MLAGDLRARAKRIAARDPKTARLLAAAAERLFDLPKLTAEDGGRRLTCGLCGETHDDPALIDGIWNGAPEDMRTVIGQTVDVPPVD